MRRRNPTKCGVVNYVTNYYGFSLADMVSVSISITKPMARRIWMEMIIMLHGTVG